MAEDLRAKLLAGLKGTKLAEVTVKVQAQPKPASVKERKRAQTSGLPKGVLFNSTPLNEVTRRDLAAETTPLWEFHVDQAKPLNTGGIEREMQSRAVPSKRAIKTTTKLSHGTRSQFGKSALKGTPGSSHVRPFANVAMIYEERTGCMVVDDETTFDNEGNLRTNDHVVALKKRLENSAKNCNTTAPHYIVTCESQDRAKSMLSITE